MGERRLKFLNQFYNGATMVKIYKDEQGEVMEATNQVAKADAGKIRPSLVPVQIIKDIAEVREYGCIKYKDPDNWKKVELQRYIDALLRHTLAFIEDPESIDNESGIKHYKHMACNLAFICQMLKK